MMQQGTNMPRGMGITQQGMGQNMGMQQQSMGQMACTTMDEFDHAMQMWSQVLQGAQGCPDVEAEARAQLGALETWRNALAQTLSRAQSADQNTQQLAQRDLYQTCAKAHTAVMLAEQTFMQEYGSAQDQTLSDIGMGNLMGGRGMGTESQYGQQQNQPWQQQQYQPSYQGTTSNQSWQTSPEQFSQRGMQSQYGQQQYQPSHQSSMEQQPWQTRQQYQPSFQSSMGSQQNQPTRGMGGQQSYVQQTHEPYSQAISQVPYAQQGMSTMGETFGPYAFSRGSYYGPMGLQQYGEPVQHERIPEPTTAWRSGIQTGMQQGQMGMGMRTGSTQSSRGSEQFGASSQQSRSSQTRQRNW